MSTQLGIISDPHAAPAALEHALSIFKQRKIKTIICAGDIAGYFDGLAATVSLLKKHRVQCIIGNHDQDFLAESTQVNSDEYRFLQQLPLSLTLTIENTRIYIAHAQPPEELHGGIKLLSVDGDVIPEQSTTVAKTVTQCGLRHPDCRPHSPGICRAYRRDTGDQPGQHCIQSQRDDSDTCLKNRLKSLRWKTGKS